MIYWIVSAVLPSWRLVTVAILSGVIATAVDFVKLYHSPGLDAFRFTLSGILPLGRSSSVQDVIAYWLAISVGG